MRARRWRNSTAGPSATARNTAMKTILTIDRTL